MPRHALKFWDPPRWLAYVLAVILPLFIAVMRLKLEPYLGDSIRYIFFTIAVCVAAFAGGLLPGVVASVVSIFLSVYIFILPNPGELERNPGTTVGLASLVSIWVFISIVCDQLRASAVAYRRIAEERDHQRELLESIMASTPDGFLVADRNWNITYLNQAFSDLSKLSAEELIGRHIGVLPYFGAGSRRMAQLESARKSHEAVVFDMCVPDGSEHWVHVRAFPTDEGLCVVIQDISDRKALEAERERLLANERHARSDAENANRMKDEFVATLSHELRTPLTTILGWAELLTRRAAGDPRYSDGLTAIERSTRLQAQLIDDLLEMSRITSGKLRLDVELINLPELVREAVRAQLPAAEGKQIQVERKFTEELVYVRGDAARITQIVSNIVSNAIKFTPSGGTIWIEVEQLNSEAIIRVTDNGEGIAPEFLPHVFGRFRQSNSKITRKHGGLGLGLSIVQQLVELHGGAVQAFSDGVGKGSTFVVRLPMASIPRMARRADLNGEPDAGDLSGRRILVVDDDDSTRDILCVLFAEQGADVLSAQSAEAALERLNTTLVDIIVSDIGMPDVDGYQFIERVRKLEDRDKAGIPAIALTAFAQERDRERALSAGYQAHLSKPVETSLLTKTVREVLEQGEAEGTVPSASSASDTL